MSARRWAARRSWRSPGAAARRGASTGRTSAGRAPAARPQTLQQSALFRTLSRLQPGYFYIREYVARQIITMVNLPVDLQWIVKQSSNSPIQCQIADSIHRSASLV